jgi:hypothetical protein
LLVRVVLSIAREGCLAAVKERTFAEVVDPKRPVPVSMSKEIIS